KWRTSINRFAEAMTLFAVACAGIFPLIHTGRPWMAFYMFPYPSTMGLWPQFRSPLIWDVFAVSTYGTVSLIFWYVGLIPDLATMRDRSKTRIRKMVYGLFALGWRGSQRHWRHYEMAYLILAGLATPLVLSVHSIVSMDFAVSQLPGWHSTIFPPYFVAGAIFSGFAMVVTLMVITRKGFGLEIIVTSLHRDFLPSSWDMYNPTIWEILTLAGSFGLFFTMFCLFARFLPVVATAEVKGVLPQANPHPAEEGHVSQAWAATAAPEAAR